MPEPSEIAGIRLQWLKEQFKPLSIFDLGKQWIDAIKIIGSGNGPGFLAAGAALNTLSTPTQKALVVTLLKCSAGSFLSGVVGFALAIVCIHVALFAHDDMAHATPQADLDNVNRHAGHSSTFMRMTNWFDAIAAPAFFVACVSAAFLMVAV